MAQDYTVQFANKTKMPADQYGNVSFNVKFNEDGDAVLWRVNPSKTVIEPGMQVYGEIQQVTSKNGSTYRKFVRINPENVQGASPAATAAYKPRTPQQQSDKEDAIMQGRCYNNAAQIVSALIIADSQVWDLNKIVTEFEKIASAIYDLPPLKHVEDHTSGSEVVLTDAQVDAPIDMSVVDELFPAAEHVQLEVK